MVRMPKLDEQIRMMCRTMTAEPLYVLLRTSLRITKDLIGFMKSRTSGDLREML